MIKQLSTIVVCGFLAACGSSPTSPSAFNDSTAGSSNERVSTLGTSIGPGAGTGTLPIIGEPHSCPEDRPTVYVNGNNGKHDFSVTKVAGQTRGYEWEIEKLQYNTFRYYARIISNVTDGRDGLYAQPDTLGTGSYRVRARALRMACNGRELGTWSEWEQFSVEGPQDNPEAPVVEVVVITPVVVPPVVTPPVVEPPVVEEPPVVPPVVPCTVYLGNNQYGPEGCVLIPGTVFP